MHNRKTLSFLFSHKPIEILGNEKTLRVEGVKFKQYTYDVDHLNSLDLSDESSVNSIKMIDTNKYTTLNAGLVVRSIGFKNVNIDANELPFDKASGIIPNDRGKVLEKPGLYCTGWIKRGPKGVIVDTTSDAHETADKLCSDLQSCSSRKSEKNGFNEIKSILNDRRVRVVDKDGWSKIDEEEIKRGKLVGKPREKLNSIQEMLNVAFS
jgi:adrenodoxin-NADP+ reductase